MSNEALSVEQEEITGSDVVQVQETFLSQDKTVSLLEIAGKLKTAKPVIQLNAEYFEFKTEKQKVKVAFIGFQNVKFKDRQNASNTELIDGVAAKWMGEDKKVYICASVALVNELQRNNIPFGAALEIEYTGKKGNTKLFNVSLLASE